MTPTRAGLAGLITVLMLGACTAPAASPTPRTACPSQAPNAATAAEVIGDTVAIEMRTNKGSFTIALDPASTPVAVANFVALAHCGFYDEISFHRVVPGFVAQAGDPQTKTDRELFEGVGTGGPGYQFEIEFPPQDTVYRTYMVAMANAMQYDFNTGEIQSGTDTNGSQFFVMLGDADFLRPYYSLIGTVVAGTEVVDAIGQVPTTGDPYNLPLDPVIIESTADTGLPNAS